MHSYICDWSIGSVVENRMGILGSPVRLNIRNRSLCLPAVANPRDLVIGITVVGGVAIL